MHGHDVEQRFSQIRRAAFRGPVAAGAIPPFDTQQQIILSVYGIFSLEVKLGGFEVLSTIQDKSGIYEAAKSHAFPFTMEMLGRNTAAGIAFLVDFLIRLFVIFFAE